MERLKNGGIREWLKVYFIMGSNNCLKDPLEVVKDALEGGVTLFQFREKGTASLSGEKRAELAKNIRNLCNKYSVPFIVNEIGRASCRERV